MARWALQDVVALHLPDIEPVARQVRDALDRGRRVLVTGPEGSGRSMLADRLVRELGDVTRIDLPALTEQDVASAILLAATSLLGADAGAYTLPTGRPEPALVEALSKLDRPVVIRIHGGGPVWGRPLARTGFHRQRVREALAALAALRHAVWLADGDLTPFFDLEPGFQRLVLPDHQTRMRLDAWGELEPAATELARYVRDVTASPVVWRLAVGAVWLGEDAVEVAARVGRPTAEVLRPLTDRIAQRLVNSDGAEAARTLLLARRPLRRDNLLGTLRTDAGWSDLFTRSLGYGDPVRVNPQVRERLSSRISEPAPEHLERAHLTLAGAFAVEDGIADPSGLSGGALAAWVEKVHHLGLAGPPGVEDWKQQHKPWPDLYWERARYYSIVRKDYEMAASIYEACLAAFPNDDYAHHYLAWNLEQLQRAPEKQRVHYAKAAELAPRNPWWNGRRVGQLIRSGAWTEALNAWRNALRAIVPAGDVTVDLVGHLHVWVADAWMDVRAWYEARAVVEAIPEPVVAEAQTANNVFRRLLRSIEEQEANEARALDAWFGQNGAEDPVIRERVQPAWALLRRRLPGLPAPAVVQGEDGPKMVWSHPGVYLEIEFVPSGELSWYARDRIDDRSEHGDAPDFDDDALRGWLTRVRHG